MNSSLITNILTGALSLSAALPQTVTNGLSILGTLNAPTVSDFLTDNPLPNGFPWGSKTADNANPYSESPNTGVIRRYDFHVARGLIAPDGYEKHGLLVNGQYPGVCAAPFRQTPLIF